MSTATASSPVTIAFTGDHSAVIRTMALVGQVLDLESVAVEPGHADDGIVVTVRTDGSGPC